MSLYEGTKGREKMAYEQVLAFTFRKIAIGYQDYDDFHLLLLV